MSIGRHLAELEADTTHGPDHRPDEATCEQCAGHYIAQCENQGWTAERRACSAAASDLINAHLCAGGASQTTGNAAADIPPTLSCTALGQHIATTIQSAGLYPDVTDMHAQVTAACELGGWPIELRQCFVAGNSIAALQACVTPGAPQ